MNAAPDSQGLQAIYELIDTMGTVGVLVAILYYFVKRDRQQDEAARTREERLASRITNLETWQQSVLVDLVSRVSAAISASTAAMNQVKDCFDKLGQHYRPSTKEDEKE